MPFTPFHLGLPMLVFGLTFLIKGRKLNSYELQIICGLAIGSVIPDLQGFYSIFFNSEVKLHGFSHTIIGGLIYAIVGIPGVFIFLKIINVGSFNPKISYVSTLSGIYLFHFVPDMFIWSDMQIYWPFSEKSYGNEENYLRIAVYLTISFAAGFFLLILGTIRIIQSQTTRSNRFQTS